MADVRENRVEDVMLGVRSYGEMASLLSQGHPFVIMGMAQWMATMLRKLVDWGALTEDEHAKVLGQMVTEVMQRRKMDAAQGDDDDPRVDGDVQALLSHLGI